MIEFSNERQYGLIGFQEVINMKLPFSINGTSYLLENGDLVAFIKTYLPDVDILTLNDWSIKYKKAIKKSNLRSYLIDRISSLIDSICINSLTNINFKKDSFEAETIFSYITEKDSDNVDELENEIDIDKFSNGLVNIYNDLLTSNPVYITSPVSHVITSWKLLENSVIFENDFVSLVLKDKCIENIRNYISENLDKSFCSSIDYMKKRIDEVNENNFVDFLFFENKWIDDVEFLRNNFTFDNFCDFFNRYKICRI